MNNIGRVRMVFGVLGVTVLSLIVGLGACAPAAAPMPAPGEQPEAKEVVINIGIIGDLSGPYAISWGGLGAIFPHALRWTEEEGGLAEGVKLVSTVMDTGGQLPKAISAFEHLMEVEPRPVILLHSHSGETSALRSRYEEEVMPCITCCGNPAVMCPSGPETMFFADIQYSGQMANFWDYLVNGGGWTKDEPIKAAMISWDSSFGRACATPENLEHMESLGIEYVGFFPIPFFPTDASSQLLAARDAGANVIFGYEHSPMKAVVLKDAVRLGLKTNDPATSRMWFVGSIPAGDQLIELAGDVACNGLFLLSNVPIWSETDIPGIKLLHKFHEDYGAGPEFEIWGYITGFDQFLIARTAIEAAIEEKGAEAVTSELVFEQLKGGVELDTMGLLPTFHYGEIARVADFQRIYQYQGGELTLVRDVRQSDPVWPAACRDALIDRF